MSNETKNYKGGSEKIKKCDGVGRVLKPIREFWFGPSRVRSKQPFGNRLRVSRSKIDQMTQAIIFIYQIEFENHLIKVECCLEQQTWSTPTLLTTKSIKLQPRLLRATTESDQKFLGFRSLFWTIINHWSSNYTRIK